MHISRQRSFEPIFWNLIFLRNRNLNKNFKQFPSSVLLKFWSCKLTISSQCTVCSKVLLRIALLMENILFLEVNDCYMLPNIWCLLLQQIFFIYQFKREVSVSTGSLLLQQAFIHSVRVSTWVNKILWILKIFWNHMNRMCILLWLVKISRKVFIDF